MVASHDTGSEQLLLWSNPGEGKVLGLSWNPDSDDFRFAIHINLSSKNRGIRLKPDLTTEEIPSIIQLVVTRRTVLGVVNTCYDPMGLLVPISIQMKLLLRDLFCKELNLGWDSPLPDSIKEEWITMFQRLKEVEILTFDRTVQPEGAIGKPWLILFWDASDEAMCVTVYILWHTSSGPISTLLCAKSRVTPLNRITTPRAEMQAATMSVRLRKYISKQG